MAERWVFPFSKALPVFLLLFLEVRLLAKASSITGAWRLFAFKNIRKVFLSGDPQLYHEYNRFCCEELCFYDTPWLAEW